MGPSQCLSGPGQSSKIVKGAILQIYAGAPHGMCSTLKDRVNAELFAFIGQGKAPRPEENA